jgi:hypothetical protein
VGVTGGEFRDQLRSGHEAGENLAHRQHFERATAARLIPMAAGLPSCSCRRDCLLYCWDLLPCVLVH